MARRQGRMLSGSSCKSRQDLRWQLHDGRGLWHWWLRRARRCRWQGWSRIQVGWSSSEDGEDGEPADEHRGLQARYPGSRAGQRLGPGPGPCWQSQSITRAVDADLMDNGWATTGQRLVRARREARPQASIRCFCCCFLVSLPPVAATSFVSPGRRANGRDEAAWPWLASVRRGRGDGGW